MHSERDQGFGIAGHNNNASVVLSHHSVSPTIKSMTTSDKSHGNAHNASYVNDVSGGLREQPSEEDSVGGNGSMQRRDPTILYHNDISNAALPGYHSNVSHASSAGTSECTGQQVNNEQPQQHYQRQHEQQPATGSRVESSSPPLESGMGLEMSTRSMLLQQQQSQPFGECSLYSGAQDGGASQGGQYVSGKYRRSTVLNSTSNSLSYLPGFDIPPNSSHYGQSQEFSHVGSHAPLHCAGSGHESSAGLNSILRSVFRQENIDYEQDFYWMNKVTYTYISTNALLSVQC